MAAKSNAEHLSAEQDKDQALFILLSRGYEDEQFELILQKYLRQGVNINELNDDEMTVLDVAFLLGDGLASKATILQNHGAETGKALEVIPKSAHASIVPGYDPRSEKSAAVGDQDFDANNQLIVVDYYLEKNIDDSDSVCVQLLNTYKNCVCQLFCDGSAEGTGFLIHERLVVVSRHCLSEMAIVDVEILFESDDTPYKVVGMIEDGAGCGLDYAILLLEVAPPVENVPNLSEDITPNSTVFVGYDTDDDLCFASFENARLTGPAAVGGIHDAYQQTTAGMSGSPYFNENGEVYALHICGGYDMKGALFIHKILDPNANSVMSSVMTGDVNYVAYDAVRFDNTTALPSYTSSDDMHFDEGKERSQTLGKNPSINRDYLRGKKNLVCKEVLYRWALKEEKKARYDGEKTDAEKAEWLDDWGNWMVSVKTTADGEREWVRLGAKNNKGKYQIQMGHKISAVSYWVHGYNANNTIVEGFFDTYNGKSTVADKRAKYNARYAQYAKPGFKRVEDGEAIVNRRFMYDAGNYRFEYGELNEAYGRQERQLIHYKNIFEHDALHPDLKSYRTHRKDKETTPLMKALLSERETTLEQNINNNHESFVRYVPEV